MNPRYVIFCVDKKVLFSRSIKNPKWRKLFIVLMLSVRHSSYVYPNILRSSMYIAIISGSSLKTTIARFISFVSFLGHEDNPFWKH